MSCHYAEIGPDGDGTDLDGYAPPRKVITEMVAARAFGMPGELFQALAEDDENYGCFDEESDELDAACAEEAWKDEVYERDVLGQDCIAKDDDGGASVEEVANYMSAVETLGPGFVGVRRAFGIEFGYWGGHGDNPDRSWKCFRDDQHRG